ncbi:MAG TPA: hypothetical protein VHT24_04685 [Pseudacidobacterium sp.]|jgi:type IV secretory pathway VirB10-like protein|nr:hypothetical protein [Pseudacidobacterium sp.]
MNTARQTAVIAGFLLTALTGCSHKSNPVPQQVQAPTPPPSSMAHYPSMPPLPPPSTPNVALATVQEEPPAPAHHRPARHKPSPSKPAASTEQTTSASAEKSASGQSQVAAGGAPSDLSPIGQLTSGGDATNIQQRHDIEQLINNTEKGVSGINRTLSNEEQETVVQIKTFLTKAKQSLTANDLDGAHTLATKAKVLLDELTKK